MIKFFSVMTIVSTVVALLASLIFFLGILFKSKTVADQEVFNTCNNEIKVCTISSAVFAILNWFVVSGLTRSECIEGYRNIALTCSRLGSVWIIFAFVNVVISVILGISKRGKDELEMMGKMRKSNFFMGAVLLIIAFLLKVN